MNGSVSKCVCVYVCVGGGEKDGVMELKGLVFCGWESGVGMLELCLLQTHQFVSETETNLR